jgi:virulence factor Mce-like protein
MTSRTSRPRRDEARPARTILGGVAVIGVLAAIAIVALRASSGLPVVDYYRFSVSMPDVGNLRGLSDVRIAGVLVGQVADTEVRQGRVRVRVRLSPGTDPLPVDTQAIVRAQGVLGARFLELRPGRSERTLADGATLRAGEGSLTAGIPDALQTFDAPTRRSLASMIDEFGAGMLARGRQTNDLIRGLPAFETDLERVSDAIVARDGAARRLAPSLDGAVAALDPAREDIARSFTPFAKGFAPFVDRGERLRATLEETAPTLAVAQPALSEGRALVAAAADVATAAEDALPDAPAGLRSTAVLLRDAREPLRRTDALLAEASATIPPARKLLRAARPVLDPLDRGFGDLRPIVRTLGEYGCDVEKLGRVFRSMFARGPKNGRVGRVGPVTDWRVTVAGFGVPGPIPAARATSDLYPKPCRSLGDNP